MTAVKPAQDVDDSIIAALMRFVKKCSDFGLSGLSFGQDMVQSSRQVKDQAVTNFKWREK